MMFKKFLASSLVSLMLLSTNSVFSSPEVLDSAVVGAEKDKSAVTVSTNEFEKSLNDSDNLKITDEDEVVGDVDGDEFEQIEKNNSDEDMQVPTYGDDDDFRDANDIDMSFDEDDKSEPVIGRFSDITSKHWSFDAVEFLADAGIVTGFPEGDFRPDDAVTRAEFAKMIVSYINDIDGNYVAPTVKVAAVGDSLTQGLIGVTEYIKTDSYPNYLASYLGGCFEVKNFGRAAFGIYENHKNYYRNTNEYKAALAYNPDVVVIIFGTNDAKVQYWGEAKANYANVFGAFIDEFASLESNPRIIIGIPTPVVGGSFLKDRPVENMAELRNIIRTTAEAKGCTVVDLNVLFEGKEYLFPDGIHFNVEGATIVANAFVPAIRTVAPAGGIYSAAIRYSDVSTYDWFCEAVSKATNAGVVNGFGSYFNPSSTIKREDAALIMYRILASSGVDFYDTHTFADGDQISEYAKNAVGALGALEFVNGDENGMFRPQETLTRAQAAQMIYSVFAQ